MNAKEAEVLRDQLHDAIHKIQKHIKGKLITYNEWVEANRPKYNGLKSTTCMSTRSSLNRLLNKPSKFDEQATGKIIYKAKQCVVSLQKFLEESSKDGFSDRTYYVYFNYMAKGAKEPRLGRAVLRTLPYNRVKLKNLNTSFSTDYVGTYDTFQNRALIFDFTAEDDTRKMRMEVLYNSTDQTWHTGAYTTFEYDHIVTGTIVFERIDGRLDPDHIKPGELCYIGPNKDEFFGIDISVRKYLARRKYNHHKITNRIASEVDFKKVISRHDAFIETKTRFFEVDNPRLFIASPSSSIDPEKRDITQKALGEISNSIEKNLENMEGGQIEVLYDDGSSDSFIEWRSQRTLGLLRLSRYFVLIIMPTQTASFSLVQLGWAFAYCKRIIVCYQSKSISSRIREIQHNVRGVHYFRYDDLANETTSIAEDISGVIKADLADLKQELL